MVWAFFKLPGVYAINELCSFYKSAVIYYKGITQTREGTDYNKNRIVT